MATVRIQIRRGTAQDWLDADAIGSGVVLAAGEMGVETDTNKFKFGNATDTWGDLPYANVTPAGLAGEGALGFVELADIGVANGVVGLDSDKNAYIPGTSIIIEGSSDDGYETTLVVTNPTADRTITIPNATGTLALTSDISTAITNLINSAPGALDTLNELAAALGDDENFSATVSAALNSKAPSSDPTFTGTVVLPSTTSIGNVSSTEINYLDGVTSDIQSQLNSKAAKDSATFTGTITLPGGTTAQRPASPTAGMTRFNTTTGYPEWYSSSASAWVQFNQGIPYTVEYLIVAGGGGGGHAYYTNDNGAWMGGGGGGIEPGVVAGDDAVLFEFAHTQRARRRRQVDLPGQGDH